MDAIGAIQAVYGAINYLYTASEKMKENQEECRRLCKHARSVVQLLQREHEQGVPQDLARRLFKLAELVISSARLCY